MGETTFYQHAYKKYRHLYCFLYFVKPFLYEKNKLVFACSGSCEGLYETKLRLNSSLIKGLSSAFFSGFLEVKLIPNSEYFFVSHEIE